MQDREFFELIIKGKQASEDLVELPGVRVFRLDWLGLWVQDLHFAAVADLHSLFDKFAAHHAAFFREIWDAHGIPPF